MYRNYLLGRFSKEIYYRDIPIVINNRDRLTTLKLLINYLRDRGYNNIIILDNASTYPPLLEWYNLTSMNIIFLDKNLGHDALEKIKLYSTIRKNYFVYTDSDVLPVEECPDDFMLVFLDALKKYPILQKVGFSLKIDDIPNEHSNKKDIIEWETQYYNKRIDSLLFDSKIDTTFALHRPYATISTKSNRIKMARTDTPYVARHLPWYTDSSDVGAEEKYYIQHVELGTTWSKGLAIKDSTRLSRVMHLLRLIVNRAPFNR